MFYKNQLITKKDTARKLKFSNIYNGLNTEHDEHLLPINYSNNTYNFSLNNGALKTGLGIDTLNLTFMAGGNVYTKQQLAPPGLKVLGVWCYSFFNEDIGVHETDIVIYCDDGKLYYTMVNSPQNEFYDIGDITLTKVPNVAKYYLNSKSSLLFTNDQDGMWVFAMGQPSYQVASAPNILSMCVHYERLFATVDGEKSEVWFSDDLDPTNWAVSLNEAGFIKLTDERGPLNKVVSLNDYVYIFRDFGITRLTAYAEQVQFNVNQLYLSSNKIFYKTVCACGDNIFYLAKDGVYVFNGLTSNKLKLNINNIINANENALAAYYNGKYFLAVRLEFDDNTKVGSENEDASNETKTNALLEIDVKTGEFNILRGVNVTVLETLNDIHVTKLIACIKQGNNVLMGEVNYGGKVFGVPTKKYWQSPLSDLGYPNKVKLIKDIYFKNEKSFTLKIITDMQEKTFYVASGKKINKVKTSIKGKSVRFVFESDETESHISDPQVVFSVL